MIDKSRWTVQELYETDFPEPRWIVPGLIPEGLTFLGGRPKIGKSWLVIQLSHAKGSQAGMFLGMQVEHGGVLFLAYEDSPRRLKSRLIAQGFPRETLVTFETNFPRFPDGFAELEIAVASGDYQLIIIDTLSRAAGKYDQLDMMEMTELTSALHNLTKTSGVSILVVDHFSKVSGENSNPVDDLFGSTGKAAVADTIIGLYRDRRKRETLLRVIGRDIEDRELALCWDASLMCWQNLGDADQVRDDTLESEILKASRELRGMMEIPTTTKIARHINQDTANVSRKIGALVTDGKMKRGERVGREVPYDVLQQ
jgi:hypothetical protein